MGTFRKGELFCIKKKFRYEVYFAILNSHKFYFPNLSDDIKLLIPKLGLI